MAAKQAVARMHTLSVADEPLWNDQISQLPGAHVLQTQQWGEVKAQYGWQPLKIAWLDDQGQWLAAAQVLKRTIVIGGFSAPFNMLYVPKGPLLSWQRAELRQQVLDDLQNLAIHHKALLIKIDPDIELGRGIPGEPGAEQNPADLAILAELQQRGWLFSNEQIQFRNTVVIDLSQSEEGILAGFKQKTRYNIRLAARKGVTVRAGGGADIPALYRMYAQTSVRDGFVIRSEAYYQTVWSTFIKSGIAEPLIAEFAGQMIAAVIPFRFAGQAWYLYGMSAEQQREKMPNYLLQWEALRRAKANGCHTYDMWGAPDEFHEGDPLWGVYRFKEGFNGRVSRRLGAWDYPARPLQYRLYTQILPRLLEWMRRRGRKLTRQQVAAVGGL